MTQIRTNVLASSSAGDVGVHSLDGLHLMVPDLEQAVKFYRAFGLDVREGPHGIALSTYDDPRVWATVSEGRKKLSHISFGIFEQDLAAFAARLQDQGVPRVDGPAGFDDGGIWFRNPDGLLMQLRVAPKSSPDAKSPFAMNSALHGTRGAPLNAAAPAIRPNRLAHILMFTGSVSGSIDFYARVLGLRLSDRVGDDAAFMHGIHGSDHHLVAFGRSSGPGLHHMSWDVPSINEIGHGAVQMLRSGYDAGWGLGRHALGSNYFHYVRDPWGSYSEYSSDIDYIAAGSEWDAQDHPPEDTFYLWGPNPPGDFAHNYEAEG